MVLVLLFLLLLFLPVAAALAFKSLAAHYIKNDILRAVAVGAVCVATLLGILRGTVDLAIGSILHPTSKLLINDTYYFTQQEYGFVTMMSQGYNLTFYRNQPFWFGKELGKVQLECTGKEAIGVTLVPTSNQTWRLRLQADGVTRLDTMLSLAEPFNFRRTFADRTIDFSERH